MYYIAIVFLQYNCDSLSVFICTCSLNTASYRCTLSIHCFENLYVQPCLTLYASVLAIYGSYVASWLLLFFLCIEGHGKREVRKAPPSGGVEDTARRHIASELLQTERNFVNILNIIVKVCRVSIQYSNHSILLYIRNQMLKLCHTDVLVHQNRVQRIQRIQMVLESISVGFNCENLIIPNCELF